jgi:hypothetical protein
MKKCFHLIIFFLLLINTKAFGLTIPENLKYDLSLGGITVGHVSLEAVNSSQYVRLDSKVDAAKWVSLFYGINDHAVSFLTRSRQKTSPINFMYQPYSYSVKLDEGQYRVNKEFVFDGAKKRISYTDVLNKEKRYYIFGDFTLDPLAGIYYLRHVPLKVGKSVFLNVFNNKLIYKVEVQVLRKETVETPLGTFKTIVIRSNMDSVGDGIIYLPGDIYIWLTDDEKKIPVMFEKRIRMLVEGKLPDLIKNAMPDFLRKKLSTGSVKAVLVNK